MKQILIFEQKLFGSCRLHANSRTINIPSPENLIHNVKKDPLSCNTNIISHLRQIPKKKQKQKRKGKNKPTSTATQFSASKSKQKSKKGTKTSQSNEIGNNPELITHSPIRKNGNFKCNPVS